jgi:hypothetical protein
VTNFVPEKPKKLTLLVPPSLLRQVQAKARQDGVNVSVIIRTALQDYLRYGLDVHIRREPPEEEPIEGSF